MERSEFISHDGKAISVCVWDEVEEPKAVVQIVHGMAEHVARYDEFAHELNKAGYIVFGDDHRAHGHTDPDRLGKAEEGKNLFEDTVKDLAALTDYAKAKWGLPVLLFGHSYGSFLSQAYLTEYSDRIAACVLSGSALYGKGLAGFSKAIATHKAKKHADEPGKFFAKMTFESYDKKVGEGHNAWLSRSAESNEKYTNDPLCEFVCSNGFYKYMFTGLKKLAKTPYTAVRSDLPLFIIYGDADYVGGRGKLTKKLVEKYISSGLTVEEKSYPGARHELINEINRAEVYEDVIEFFDNVASGKWNDIVREFDGEESE